MREAISIAMRVHFWHRHVRDTGVILEEVNLPHPRCPQCYMLVPWYSLNRKHVTTSQCLKGAEQKRQRLEEEGIQESMESSFQAYVRSLARVASFKYIRRVLKAVDDEWPVVVGNLQK